MSINNQKLLITKTITYVPIVLTLIIVGMVYLFSLNREWQFFDERMFYEEGLFPIATNFKEFLELISTYALTYHSDSQNTFFSNIINYRYTNALGATLNMFILFLFKKNSFLYHLLQLLVHLLNTTIIYFIFRKLFEIFSKEKYILLPTILSILWALHPEHVEAVLLVTNWTNIFSYTLGFSIILFVLNKINTGNIGLSRKEFALILFIFLLSLLISEYNYTLPFIVLFILPAAVYTKNPNNQNSVKASLKLSAPLFLGLALFSVSYLFLNFQVLSKNISLNNPLAFLIERIIWLAPQIFMHYIKLFLTIANPSINQSSWVNLSTNYISLYSVFCILILFFLIILPFVTLLFKKSKWSFTFLTIYSFIFSMFPFLHIAAPTYSLASDRYCYFPLFILFSIGCIFLSQINFQTPKNKILLVLLSFLLTGCSGIKTINRINDWKNTISLYTSDLKHETNSLYRGQLYSILAYHFSSTGRINEMKKYSLLSIKEFSRSIEKLQSKDLNHEPLALKIYGLDKKSLMLRAAFAISDIRFNFLNEPPSPILEFYEPYIKPQIKNAGNSQLVLYAKLLNSLNKTKKAIKILEEARNKYPYAPSLIFTLSNLYLKNNAFKKAEDLITKAYKYYPSHPRMLLRMVKLSTLKNDKLSIAKYEYLTGLRVHSQEGLQKSLQIYLNLQKIKEAKKVVMKLASLDTKNPVTLLLLAKYYNLTNKKEKILPTLYEAYSSAKDKISKGNLNPHVLESIILSIISYKVEKGEKESIRGLLFELESLPNLLPQNKNYLSYIKEKITKESNTQ